MRREQNRRDFFWRIKRSGLLMKSTDRKQTTQLHSHLNSFTDDQTSFRTCAQLVNSVWINRGPKTWPLACRVVIGRAFHGFNGRTWKQKDTLLAFYNTPMSGAGRRRPSVSLAHICFSYCVLGTFWNLFLSLICPASVTYTNTAVLSVWIITFNIYSWTHHPSQTQKNSSKHLFFYVLMVKILLLFIVFTNAS